MINIAQKLIYKDVKDYIENILNKNYELISTDYINNTSKLKIKCNNNHIFYKSLVVFKMGSINCPYCDKQPNMNYQKRTNEIIENINQAGYKFINSKINNNYRIVTVECPMEHQYEVRWNHFKNGSRCPYCQGRYKNEKEIKEIIYQLVKNEYKIISEYKNMSSKVIFKHILCGYEWKLSPISFINSNHRCPRCAGVVKKSSEEFKKQLYNKVGDEYIVLEEYEKAHKPLLIKHQICQEEYYVSPNNIINNNRRCPFCQSSFGVKIVRLYLKNRNITFKEQFTFDDCRNINLLRFDFALFRDGKVKYIIEYDGQFHYENIYNDKYRFELIQNNDAIKTNYCKSNNISLLRIPYWEINNIETILEQNLILN